MTYQATWSENDPTAEVDPPILDVNLLAEYFLGEEEFGLQEEAHAYGIESSPELGSFTPATSNGYALSPREPFLVTPETNGGSIKEPQELSAIAPNASTRAFANQPFDMSLPTRADSSTNPFSASSHVPPTHFTGIPGITAYANPINMVSANGHTGSTNQAHFSMSAVASQPVSTQFETVSAVPNMTLADLQKLFQQHEQTKIPEPSMEPVYAVALEQNPTIPKATPAVTEASVPFGQKATSSQIDRRRERNRILARKTRERKKAAFETLQEEVLELQRQNELLKNLVETTIPEPHHILNECDAMDKIPESVFEACGRDIDSSQMENDDFDFVRGIQEAQQAFVITDPTMEDNPIVFASPDFLTLTGYSSVQVLGRNCRFLQGKDTSPDKLAEIRKALALGEDVTVTLINYTADGSPFWNKLFIAALRDIENNIVNYIGVSVKVASPPPGDPEFGMTLDGE